MSEKITFVYKNQLDTESFIHMLDDVTECYKFYWLSALLSLFLRGKTEILFNEIIDKMIADAWYSVVEYHLHLGPKNTDGVVMNSLERAVLRLEKLSECGNMASEEEILAAIAEYDKDEEIKKAKDQLTKNVLYRLLASFMPEITGNDRIWDQRTRLIDYIHGIYEIKCLPYEIWGGRGREKKIHIHEKWQDFFRDNYVTIQGWIELKKVRYLQGRNPGVPGIIYKLERENKKQRKLRYARELWEAVMELSPVRDIYLNEAIQKEAYDMDHFVPWSFIANDELWNLMPMESYLNSAKNNKLPPWDRYFTAFAANQYQMFDQVQKYEKIREKFEKCNRDNLVTSWSMEELYVPGCKMETFCHVLEKNLYPIYESARMQGYGIWKIG